MKNHFSPGVDSRSKCALEKCIFANVPPGLRFFEPHGMGVGHFLLSLKSLRCFPALFIIRGAKIPERMIKLELNHKNTTINHDVKMYLLSLLT